MKFNILFTISLLISFLSHGQVERSNLEILDDSLNNIIFVDSISYSTKIALSKKIIPLAKKENNKELECTTLMNIGHFFLQIGAFKSSQKFIQEAHELAHELNKPSYLAKINLLYGNYYNHLLDDKNSLKYYLEAEKYVDKITNYNIILSIYNGIAISNFELNNIEKSMEYYKKCLLISDSTDNLRYTCLTLLNLGISFEKLNRIDSSLFFLKKANEIAISIDSKEMQANANMAMAQTYLKISNFKMTQFHIQKSNNLAVENNFITLIMDNSKIESDLFLKQKKYKEAFKSLTNYQLLYDSIYNEKNTLQINELQELFEVETKEKLLNEEISKNEFLKQKQKISDLKFKSIVIIFAILLASALFFSYRIRTSYKRKKELELIQKRLLKSEIEKKNLEKNKLNEELAMKNKDLTEFAINISKKHEFSEKILSSLKVLKSIKDETKRDSFLKELIMSIRGEINVYDGLKVFQDNIEKVNHEFFNHLTQKFSDLTKTEIQMCGLIRLKLSNKDIAIIKNISPESAKVSRHRLRKKLKLNPSDNILQFLTEI